MEDGGSYGSADWGDGGRSDGAEWDGGGSSDGAEWDGGGSSDGAEWEGGNVSEVVPTALVGAPQAGTWRHMAPFDDIPASTGIDLASSGMCAASDACSEWEDEWEDEREDEGRPQRQRFFEPEAPLSSGLEYE